MKSTLRDHGTGFLGAVLLLFARVLPGADCNENGLDDVEETRPTQPALAAGGAVSLDGRPASVQAADIDDDGDGDLFATHATASSPSSTCEEHEPCA